MRAIFLVFSVAFVAVAAQADEGPNDSRPNIVLILADDMGYSDVGAYGSEIRTPNIDSLAERGVQLTGYRTGPTCGPTRAMLMTGVDHHRAGIGINAAALRRLPELAGREGYEGFLNNRVVTVANLLRDAGYATFMTGKWDLGGAPGQRPTDRGFDRYFGIPAAGASHFSDAVGTFYPVRDAVYLDDDRRVSPPDGFYSSDGYTSRMLEYLGGLDEDRPYFAYVAYTAPHWPLQVPDAWLDRYRGAYDAGWEVVRQQRLDRQKDLGLLPADAELPPLDRAVRRWSSLTPIERAVESRRMEIYAAMIELMDRNIGRLLEYVAADNARETIVIFLSDNGSEANDVSAIVDNPYWIPARFDNRLPNMGRRDSYVWLGFGWGHATSTPFRLWKSHVTEGGIRAPALFYSTRERFATRRLDDLVTVRDVAPTLLELAGTRHPGDRYREREVLAPSGRSALDYLAGRATTLHGDEPVGWELYGNRALLRGNRKALLVWPPEGSGEWQLFDSANDPAETNDLAAAEPAALEAMIRAWEAYAETNGVAIFDRDLGYGRYAESGRQGN